MYRSVKYPINISTYFGGALPVRLSCGMGKGVAGRGCTVPKVNMPLLWKSGGNCVNRALLSNCVNKSLLLEQETEQLLTPLC